MCIAARATSSTTTPSVEEISEEKILYGKGLFYIGGNRGRGQAHHGHLAWLWLILSCLFCVVMGLMVFIRGVLQEGPIIKQSVEHAFGQKVPYSST